MEELNFDQMESLDGGSGFTNALDGFCGVVALLSTGPGVYILAGGAVATGGAVAWLWGGSVALCVVHATIQLAN